MITTRRPGQKQPNHILCVVTDAHSTIVHTEATLDTWWNSLPPELKAEIYEAMLDGAAPEPAPVPPWIEQGLQQLCSMQQRAEEILRRPLQPATQN